MADYISRDKINEAFESIWDCADMVFEPDDHCCAADDCGHCKWLQTKNAIKKKLDHIQPADVRPVVRGRWEPGETIFFCGVEHTAPRTCSVCGRSALDEPWYFCPNCGAEMREEDNNG